MTDADVDGSAHPHAAADVLLPADAARCIARGYLYIAQPPLYRVKQRQEGAVPEGRGRARPLSCSTRGTDGLMRARRGAGVALSGEPLRAPARRPRSLPGAALQAVDRKRDSRVIAAFVRATDLAREDLARREQARVRRQAVQPRVWPTKYPDFGPFDVERRARRGARRCYDRARPAPRGRRSRLTQFDFAFSARRRVREARRDRARRALRRASRPSTRSTVTSKRSPRRELIGDADASAIATWPRAARKGSTSSATRASVR